jgi:hypothetical protein
MKKQFTRPARLVCAMICIVLLCGLTACGKEKAPPDVSQTESEPTFSISPPQEPEKPALYPTAVETITQGNGRQIIKTYILADDESPRDIPRDSFTSDGWHYELADIIKSETGGTDTRPHVETVDLETESNDLIAILEQLSPTLAYESEDGYSGVLTLDISSVECEAAGYENSSYTVTVMREYADFPANDLSYIPKTVTENGRTLMLDSVEWQAQSSIHVGYTDVPDSYRAVAKYVGTATQRVATGYITTAEYAGEITKEIAGETVYTAYYIGEEIIAAPVGDSGELIGDNEKTASPSTIPYPLFIIFALLAGAAAFLLLRHNVKVYSLGEDKNPILVAKVRVSTKNPVINLTPLENHSESRFLLEIDRLTAKALNGKTVEVVFGSVKLTCPIAFEGNPYVIEANFREATIKAIY